jgi:hypothetical protein
VQTKNIALGVGLGLGIPAILFSVAACWFARRRWIKTVPVATAERDEVFSKGELDAAGPRAGGGGGGGLGGNGGVGPDYHSVPYGENVSAGRATFSPGAWTSSDMNMNTHEAMSENLHEAPPSQFNVHKSPGQFAQLPPELESPSNPPRMYREP